MTMNDWVQIRRDEILSLPTPCYVHSQKLLDEHLRHVTQQMQGLVELVYSVKANPHPQILDAVRDHVSGFDVSSLSEAKAVASRASNRKVSFVGPAKTPRDHLRFLELIPHGLIVVESVEELNELQSWSASQSKEITICLRVDLSGKVGPNGKTISESLQFGLSEAEAIAATRDWPKQSRVKLLGFHFHSFSQHIHHESLLQHFAASEQFLKSIATLGFKPELINFGSGMKLPYFENTEPFNLAAFRTSLSSLLKNIRALLNTGARIDMESGRYLVGGSGVFVTRVIRKKQRANETFLILDGGFPQNAMITGVHMPLRRNFKHHLLKVKSSSASDALHSYSAFGPSCSVNDIVLQKTELPNVEVGDLIWFENMGAYGKSFSPTGFLSFDEPREFFL